MVIAKRPRRRKASQKKLIDMASDTMEMGMLTISILRHVAAVGAAAAMASLSRVAALRLP